MKKQKLLLLLGLSLAFASAATTSYAFGLRDYFGRYICELHPLEGGSDKAGAVLMIFPDGSGGFGAGGTLVGAKQTDQQCPLSMCRGTSCGGFTFSNPSSYKVGLDGRGTSAENYYRVASLACSAVSFTTGATFLLSADGRQTKVVYFDSLEDTDNIWGDKRAVGNCIADPPPTN